MAVVNTIPNYMQPLITTQSVSSRLKELVQRSLLGYNMQTEHFEFHRLIKEFFLCSSRSEGNGDGVRHIFIVNFQFFFARRLSELTALFSHSPKSAIEALETEKHNIRYFLEGVIDHL